MSLGLDLIAFEEAIETKLDAILPDASVGTYDTWTELRDRGEPINAPSVFFAFDGMDQEEIGNTNAAILVEVNLKWNLLIVAESFRSGRDKRRETGEGLYDLYELIMDGLTGSNLGIDATMEATLGELRPFEVVLGQELIYELPVSWIHYTVME